MESNVFFKVFLRPTGIPIGPVFELKSIMSGSRLDIENFPPCITGECLKIAFFVLIFTVPNRTGGFSMLWLFRKRLLIEDDQYSKDE